jgi:hypothetical protein
MQAATLAIDYSRGPEDWKDLSNEQAESILESHENDPNNRSPR